MASSTNTIKPDLNNNSTTADSNGNEHTNRWDFCDDDTMEPDPDDDGTMEPDPDDDGTMRPGFDDDSTIADSDGDEHTSRWDFCDNGTMRPDLDDDSTTADSNGDEHTSRWDFCDDGTMEPDPDDDGTAADADGDGHTKHWYTDITLEERVRLGFDPQAKDIPAQVSIGKHFIFIRGLSFHHLDTQLLVECEMHRVPPRTLTHLVPLRGGCKVLIDRNVTLAEAIRWNKQACLFFESRTLSPGPTIDTSATGVAYEADDVPQHTEHWKTQLGPRDCINLGLEIEGIAVQVWIGHEWIYIRGSSFLELNTHLLAECKRRKCLRTLSELTTMDGASWALIDRNATLAEAITSFRCMHQHTFLSFKTKPLIAGAFGQEQGEPERVGHALSIEI